LPNHGETEADDYPKPTSKNACGEHLPVETVDLYKSAPWYKFGYQIPSTFNEALAFDKANGNSKWQDATVLEMKQLFDYDCFEDGGIHGEAPNPGGYKKIRGRLVYDAKQNGRHKA